MTDLISRAYILAEYDRQHKGPPGGARKIMEDAPAVDAAPVVHGRWIGWRHHWAWLVCDQCNEKMLVRKSNHGYIQQFPHNFCPNCGAKMDAEVTA